jgi:hypothetical protein
VEDAQAVAGFVALAEGMVSEAEQRLREARESREARGDTRRIAYGDVFQSLMALAQGDLSSAARLAYGSVRWFEESGDAIGLAQALEVCSCLAARRGNQELADRLFGTAARMRTQSQAPLPSAYRALYERCASATIPGAEWGRDPTPVVSSAMEKASAPKEALTLAALLSP